MIGPFKVTKNDGKGRYIISIHNAVVNISGEAIFSYNLNAVNLISFYFCNVTFCKDVFFTMNGDSEILDSISQVITLHSDLPYIKVMENTNIRFINNAYLHQVNVIKVNIKDYTPYPFVYSNIMTLLLQEMYRMKITV